jgi:hypothetical protein
LWEGLTFGRSELHSYELTRKLMGDATPSFFPPNSSPVLNALDLGSGDDHWIAHAAQVWGAHGTRITGILMPLSTEEEQTALPGKENENVTLLRHNLYVYMSNSATLWTVR